MLIIKVGSTFPELAAAGDFENWTADGTGLPQNALRVWDAVCAPHDPPPGDWRGAVITGSHAMVSDREPWSEALAGWLRNAVTAQLPVLGICYGHQLLAHAMGGTVDYHPRGREIGTVEVRLTDAAGRDPLFGDLPPVFFAHATHAQSVVALPPGAVLLAGNDDEPHHAFRLGRLAWGVQFHPEYDPFLMRAYVTAQADALAAVGRDWRRIRSAVRATPEACGLLRRFADLCAPATAAQD